VFGGVVDHRAQSVGVFNRTVELLWWKEKKVKVSGFKLAAIKKHIMTMGIKKTK
jgi:hypothetical protein